MLFEKPGGFWLHCFLFPATSESDICFHTRHKNKNKRKMLENTAAFKSALVLRPRFKRFEPSPAVRLNGGFFTLLDDGGSRCEEQHIGRFHCVMLSPRARGIKAPPVDHRSHSCTTNTTLHVKYPHLKCQRSSSDYTFLYCFLCMLKWDSEAGMWCSLSTIILLYLQRLHMYLSEQAHNLYCKASPRQVAINSTRAWHYRLSHTALSVTPQTTYTKPEQTYNHESDRKGSLSKKLAAWLNGCFPSKCQEVSSGSGRDWQWIKHEIMRRGFSSGEKKTESVTRGGLRAASIQSSINGSIPTAVDWWSNTDVALQLLQMLCKQYFELLGTIYDKYHNQGCN